MDEGEWFRGDKKKKGARKGQAAGSGEEQSSKKDP